MRSNSSKKDSIKTYFGTLKGISIEEIIAYSGLTFKKNDKGWLARLSKKLISDNIGSDDANFNESLEVKTIVVNNDNVPREHMSFPNFSQSKIVIEKWEDSIFYSKIEKEFLFLIFKEGTDKKLFFYKYIFWDMPYEDRILARNCWIQTKETIESKKFKFISPKDEKKFHVRPKGRNGADKDLDPSNPGLTKLCFWFNKKYITEITKLN